MTDPQSRPTELRERWKSCADTIGVDPEAEDESELRLIRAEAGTRDSQWLSTGKIPEITF